MIHADDLDSNHRPQILSLGNESTACIPKWEIDCRTKSAYTRSRAVRLPNANVFVAELIARGLAGNLVERPSTEEIPDEFENHGFSRSSGGLPRESKVDAFLAVLSDFIAMQSIGNHLEEKAGTRK
jgi:hypothetical protein